MGAPETKRAHGEPPLAVRVARALTKYGWSDLTPEVLHKAKLCLYDLFSSSFAAGDLPWSQQAASLARRNSIGAVNGAPIIGTDDVVGPLDAAFANGVLSHGLVRDDMHLGSVSHLGTVLVPTLLALAPASKANGRDWLTALVAGYEAGGKIGRMIIDVEVSKIFRPTGITGPIAGAAAGAKLLGLDAEQTASALAIAANAAAGYNEWAATGGSEMFFHTGFAARSAVSAVLLAAEGAYASRTAIDGEAGLLAAFRKGLKPKVPDLFADHPEILAVFFKPVPGCNFAQSPAQAALAIARRRRLRGDDIERIAVRVTRAAALYPGCDVSGPFEHVLQAKMSIHYHVAAALLHGDFAETNYVPQRNTDVVSLAGRTRLEVDHDLTSAFPAKQGAVVTVNLRSGDTLTERFDDVVPANASDVHERFVAAAGGRLGTKPAADLDKLIATFEACSDAAELGRLTRKLPA